MFQGVIASFAHSVFNRGALQNKIAQIAILFTISMKRNLCKFFKKLDKK